jgi:hypothetical protein
MRRMTPAAILITFGWERERGGQRTVIVVFGSHRAAGETSDPRDPQSLS